MIEPPPSVRDVPGPAAGCRTWYATEAVSPRAASRAAKLLSLALGLGGLLCALNAAAQGCASLPTPGEKPPPGSDKFALAAAHCPLIGEAAPARRARQLDLYSPTVRLGDGPAPEPAAAPTVRLAPVRLPAPPSPLPPKPPAVTTPTAPAAPLPLDRGGLRVVGLAPTVLDAARAHGLDPLLLHAIAHVESRHSADAVSSAGALGVMQVMPATALQLGVARPERQLHDPATNLQASAALLQRLMARYPEQLDLVLAAYNAGEGAVERHGRRVPPFAETQDYVRKVGSVYRRLSHEFVVDAEGRLVLRQGAAS